MKKLLMMIGAAAVAVGANADVFYVTNTVGAVSVTPTSDVKWLFKIDPDAGKAYPGANSETVPNGSWSANTALALDPQKTVTIPRKVTVDGVDYPINEIAPRCFLADTTIENVIALDNIDTVQWRAFIDSTTKHVLFKGPNTASDGTQPLAWLKPTVSGKFRVFEKANSLKLVIVGPGLKAYYDADRMYMPTASNASILVPDFTIVGNWRALHDSTVGGTNNRVVRYGPDSDFAMAMGDTEMTFYPNNEAGLTNVLSFASTIKTAFDMDVKIAITNRIEMSEGVQITEAMLQNVTLEAPPWYLTFAVKSQAQLDNVLAAVSADVPIIIDIDGAGKNQITVPNGRKVAILAKSGWTFGKKLNGLIISFF